jgi:predicted nucleotidyltransferase component of viral defense system
MEFKMNLHQNQILFKEAVEATAQYKKLSEIYIEKDYWVTLALHTIFTNEIGNQVVFKGGTALSKCFGIIDRFSEDIDLVVLRNAGESDNLLSNKLKKIGKCLQNVLPEVEIEGITQKRGMNRKTAHRYQKVFEGDTGQVRRDIILEATWLGYFEPYTVAQIQSYIAEMMIAQQQMPLIQTYALQAFSVKVLTKERTFCEKIMSLVKFCFKPDPIFDLNNKVRHIYDIHKLLNDNDIYAFFKSPAFEIMLLKVANDDFVSYKNDNEWLHNHPAKAILFSEIDQTWNQIRKTYQTDFKALVYGQLPLETTILKTLQEIAIRIQPIEWNVGQKS